MKIEPSRGFGGGGVGDVGVGIKGSHPFAKGHRGLGRGPCGDNVAEFRAKAEVIAMCFLSSLLPPARHLGLEECGAELREGGVEGDSILG